LQIKKQNSIFDGLEEKETVWMSHGDKVESLPKGFEVIGSTLDCETAAIANTKKQLYGFQFHPEVFHTKKGLKMIENFVVGVCKAKQEWLMKEFAKQKIEEIKKQAIDKKVIVLVSGGVDSTVCLCLISKALGKDRVLGLHFDTGFMRKNESKEVIEEINKQEYSEVKLVDASSEFFKSLEGIIDPEKKRERQANGHKA